jgi:hypothetical protein
VGAYRNYNILMAFRRIESDKLKSDYGTQSLWFRDPENSRELFINFSRSEIVFFEFTLNNRVLVGGAHKPLSHGIVQETQTNHNIEFKKSHLVHKLEKNSSIYKDLLGDVLQILKEIVEIESDMKEALTHFIVDEDNEGQNPLIIDDDFIGFRELEDELVHPFIMFLGRYWVKILIGIIFMGVSGIVFEFYNEGDFDKRCFQGDMMSCRHQVVFSTFSKDKKKAKEYFSQMSKIVRNRKCHEGSFADCYEALESKMQKVRPVKQLKDLETEKLLLDKKSCANAYALGCFGLYTHYKNLKNMDQAKSFLRKSCELKNSQACEMINNENSETHLLELCKASDEAACGKMANLYITKGKGDQVIGLLENLCQKKNPGACSSLGSYFLRKRKMDSAIKFFNIGCDQDDMKSCYNVLYQKVSDKQGLEGLTSSCDFKDLESCLEIVKLYRKFKIKNGLKLTLKKVCTEFSHEESCLNN